EPFGRQGAQGFGHLLTERVVALRLLVRRRLFFLIGGSGHFALLSECPRDLLEYAKRVRVVGLRVAPGFGQSPNATARRVQQARTLKGECLILDTKYIVEVMNSNIYSGGRRRF